QVVTAPERRTSPATRPRCFALHVVEDTTTEGKEDRPPYAPYREFCRGGPSRAAERSGSHGRPVEVGSRIVGGESTRANGHALQECGHRFFERTRTPLPGTCSHRV